MKIKGKNNKARIRQRQEEASNRQKIRESRTPAQQLKLVKTRPGESKKEKLLLVKLIEQANEKENS
tara:strand:+ start:64 stop:261 length:198 start_codon:yes stop_codon:yes gene_type:complete